MQISTKTGVVHAILSSFDVAEENSAEAPGTAIPCDLICGDLARRIAVNITKLPELSPEVLNALRVYLVKSESSDKPSVVPNRW